MPGMLSKRNATGALLATLVDTWRKNYGKEDGRRAYQQPLEIHEPPPPVGYGASGIRAPKDSLWRVVVRHFRALDRRPPSHVPFFNGNLFKPHFIEDLIVGDEWLAGFIGDLSDDESAYLFNVIPVEILGSVYERFLGNVLRVRGRGVELEPKPEVRKAGGVYYTPRYIVNYIVEQTVGKLLDDIAAEKETDGVKAFATHTEKLRLLDPACGSGSFLIRAFERVCEHWQRRLTADLPDKTQIEARTAWEKKHRQLCWVDASTGDVHLTVSLKRQILTQNIYGVDIDSGAVEVTQLSLYLKMLENENRTTLQLQRELLPEENVALLPPLQDNIKCGNSLIASDFSMMAEDLVRINAFDWPVGFATIMNAGGFDAVVGNPPWGADLPEENEGYFTNTFKVAQNNITDSYAIFMERAVTLLRNGGRFSFIVPDTFLRKDGYRALREVFLNDYVVEEMVETGPVFSQVRDTWCLIFTLRREKPTEVSEILHKKISRFVVAAEERLERFIKSNFEQVGTVRQQYWKNKPGMIVGYLASASAQKLISKVEVNPCLGKLSDAFIISRGEEGSKFNLKPSQSQKFWIVIPENVHRYDLTNGMPISLSSLTTGKVEGFYKHPKLWVVRIQKMRWPQRVVSVFDARRNSGAMKTLQVIVSKRDDEITLKYLQAILASKLETSAKLF